MSGPPIEARFLSRPNRFLVLAAVEGHVVPAFLPNPGRLQELLRPQAPLLLLPRPNGRRRTQFDVLAVRAGREWVCLDTRAANDAVARALADGSLRGFSAYRRIRSEPAWRGGRFDFLLEDPGRCWIEVKSCSLVVDGRALFPDAPTERGTRHLRGLREAVHEGDRTALVFVILRAARSFAPNGATDPAFAEELRRAAHAGVEIHARRGILRGTRLVLGDPISTDL